MSTASPGGKRKRPDTEPNHLDSRASDFADGEDCDVIDLTGDADEVISRCARAPIPHSLLSTV